MDRILLPNQEKVGTRREKENHTYLPILETDTIKQAEMKRKIRKENPKRTRKLPKNPSLKQKSHQRNKLQGCLPSKRHGIILQINKGRIQIDQTTRKLITIHKKLHRQLIRIKKTSGKRTLQH